jgi:retron-type reverse transcriptase
MISRLGVRSGDSRNRVSALKGLLDHVSHDWLMRFLEHRIKDPVFLQILKSFLKAGVQARRDFSRKLKWGPCDFSSEK